MQALLSVALRLSAVGGKFAVMLILAREAGVEEVGKFALFFGAVNLFGYLIGLDFHLFTIRDLVARRTISGKLRVILGQGVFNFSVYIIISVIVSALLISGYYAEIPVPLLWFFAILIGDHLAQELSRQFLVLRRPNLSNIIYAAKTGLWGWIGSALIISGSIPAAVESFYVLWLAADIGAICLGLLALARMMRAAKPSLPPDMLKWTQRGLHISKYFYFTSVSTMGIAYLDRFLIAHQVSIADAGTYAFWQSIASLLTVIAYAMAGMHYLPMLLESYKRNRIDEFNSLARAFLWKTLAIAVVSGSAILILSFWLPSLVGRSEFAAPVSFVLLVVVAAALNALWQVPYQVLYSAGDDKWLAATLVLVMTASVILDFLIIPLWQINGAALVAAFTNGAIYVVLNRRAGRRREILIAHSSVTPSPL